MIEARCHCGALSWRTPALPEHLMRCTCSYCRRAGALWGEVDAQATVLTGAEKAHRYSHGDRMLDFVSCATCAMLGWWESRPGHGERLKLNFRLADPELVSGLRIRTFDGAGGWRYLD
ncbi:MAG: hypothetical protein RIA71_12305 [Oceanicaulis sp.]